jgi:hypothetical protein
MKQIKIAISTFFVIIVVATALALAPKKNNNYCVRSTTGQFCSSSQTCSSTLLDVDQRGIHKYCTATIPAGGCTGTTPCSSSNPVFLDNEN